MDAVRLPYDGERTVTASVLWTNKEVILVHIVLTAAIGVLVSVIITVVGVY